MDSNGFSLQGQLAVVTGGGGSLGREIGRALRTAGAEVVVVGRNAKTCRESADELEGHFVLMDVGDPRSVREATQEILDEHGRIDVLVNNAGIADTTPAEEMADKQWRDMLSVNLDGVFWCCREVGRAMLEHGTGSIINIASMSGVISNKPQPQVAYETSKAGVIMLTKSLASEWASRGVRVNAVSPGYIATPLTELGMSNPEWRETWLAFTPMGRVAEPREITPAIIYLASDASSFATGSNLIIDGGYTAW